MAQSKSELAYRFRAADNPPTWTETAKKIGSPSSHKDVLRATKRFAHKRKLPWPPTAEGVALLDAGKAPTPCRLAADKRNAARYEKGDVTDSVREYAARHNLPWPPPNHPVRAKHRMAYELRAEGLHWNDVRDKVGYAYSSHVVEAARKHAEREGLEWPLPVDPVMPETTPYLEMLRARAKRIYEAKERGGATWRTIAKEHGLSKGDRAASIARRHAERNDLPWPIEPKPIEPKVFKPLEG